MNLFSLAYFSPTISSDPIDPSTVTFNFWRGQVKKIRRHYWKKRLKISKIAKFEPKWFAENYRRYMYSSSKLQNLTTFVWWGGSANLPPTPLPIQTSLNFRNFASLYLRSFKHSLSNLASLLILRRTSQWRRRTFPNLSMSELKKTVEVSYG